MYFIFVIVCYFYCVGDCIFENSFCGWRNSKIDNYDWVLQLGNYSGILFYFSGDYIFGVRKGQCYYIYLNRDI